MTEPLDAEDYIRRATIQVHWDSEECRQMSEHCTNGQPIELGVPGASQSMFFVTKGEAHFDLASRTNTVLFTLREAKE